MGPVGYSIKNPDCLLKREQGKNQQCPMLIKVADIVDQLMLTIRSRKTPRTVLHEVRAIRPIFDLFRDR